VMDAGAGTCQCGYPGLVPASAAGHPEDLAPASPARCSTVSPTTGRTAPPSAYLMAGASHGCSISYPAAPPRTSPSPRCPTASPRVRRPAAASPSCVAQLRPCGAGGV
jgi:hypothetical protein